MVQILESGAVLQSRYKILSKGIIPLRAVRLIPNGLKKSGTVSLDNLEIMIINDGATPEHTIKRLVSDKIIKIYGNVVTLTQYGQVACIIEEIVKNKICEKCRESKINCESCAHVFTNAQHIHNGHLEILASLDKPRTLGDLSEHLEKKRNVVNNDTSELVKMGLIASKRSISNAQKKEYVLTENGEEVISSQIAMNLVRSGDVPVLIPATNWIAHLGQQYPDLMNGNLKIILENSLMELKKLSALGQRWGSYQTLKMTKFVSFPGAITFIPTQRMADQKGLKLELTNIINSSDSMNSLGRDLDIITVGVETIVMKTWSLRSEIVVIAIIHHPNGYQLMRIGEPNRKISYNQSSSAESRLADLIEQRGEARKLDFGSNDYNDVNKCILDGDARDFITRQPFKESYEFAQNAVVLKQFPFDMALVTYKSILEKKGQEIKQFLNLLESGLNSLQNNALLGMLAVDYAKQIDPFNRTKKLNAGFSRVIEQILRSGEYREVFHH